MMARQPIYEDYLPANPKAKKPAATPAPTPAPAKAPVPSPVLAQFNASPQQQAAVVAQVIAAAVVNSPTVVNAPANTAPTPAAVQKVAQEIAAVIAPTVAPNLPPAIIQSIILGTANAVVSNPQVKAADVGQTVAPTVIQKIADVVVKTPEVVKAVETVAPPTPTPEQLNAIMGTTPVPAPAPTPAPVPTPETSSGSSQVFPGDFGDGGAVGEFVTPEGTGPTGPTGTGPTGPTGDTVWTASDGTKFTDQNAFVKYEEIISGRNADKASAAAQLQIDEENRKLERQSAYDLLLQQFQQYGLGGLVEPLKGLIISGSSPSEFTIKLRETDAYKKRFAANAQRVAKGLRALSEAEYIGMEDQYQNVMRQYGLPETYYSRGEMGRQEGFEKFIAGDVSAVELEDRIGTAQKRVLNANPEVTAALKQFYPDIKNGDILAYTLDPKNAIKEIQRKVTAAEIGGAALQAGLQTGVNRADVLRAAGVTKESAEQGFGTIAGGLQRGSQLASIYGEDPYTQATAETEVFRLSGQQEARKQRQKITGLEKATFGGQTGLTSGALVRDRAGGY